MAVALALLAALAFALGSVLQQKGTLQTAAADEDPRFLLQVFHRPVWVAGGLAQAAGWVLQGAALDRGSLVVVQGLTSLSLVMALPLGAWITRQVITRAVWAGAGAVTAGIVLLLSAGSPQGGSSSPGAGDWLLAGVVATASVALLAWRGRDRRGSRRAMLLGAAAGVCFALQASVTKVFVPLVGNGLHAILASWTVYALIVSALAGFAFQQAALKTAALAPAIASSNAVTLLGSVVFGVTVFGESLSGGGARWVPALVGLGMAVVGMGLLTGSEVPSNPVPTRAGGDPDRW